MNLGYHMLKNNTFGANSSKLTILLQTTLMLTFF